MTTQAKLFTVILGSVFLALVSNVVMRTEGQEQALSRTHNQIREFVRELKHDMSPSLRDMVPLSTTASPHHGIPARRLPHTHIGAPDPLVQLSASLSATPSPLVGFPGLGSGDYGFNVAAAPPDTNGSAGATQYVQWVNLSFAVFDKTTGILQYGPAAGSTLWTGFGGGCETNNDGDPLAQYDKLAGRWVMTQFSVSTTPYLQCLAISTTSDAMGPWFRYALSMGPDFPDYPKLGVWPDAYYMSFNMFSGSAFAGAKACALNRTNMLVGLPTTAVCFQLSSSYSGLLPSDLDGASPPLAGSPNSFLNFGSNSLRLWQFHTDFIAPGNSTFTGPTAIPVAAFSPACNGGTCIPQLGTSQRLDSLGDRLMYRPAYRNFAGANPPHESLVVNHSVTAARRTGVRWYELRRSGGAWSVFQQGTYSPDTNFRWMGSIAMDKAGNIAVGYSVSSKQINPSIRYAGRVPTDPLGTLETEVAIKVGTGSQLSSLNRWGDYSSMSIDPIDDCTFFYTTEYLKNYGTFNWSTWIAKLKFPSCQ